MRKRILYVEDEPFLSRLVVDMLEGHDYDVLLNPDGSKVLESFDQFHPDLCILDIMLPNIDGLELGRILRKKNPYVPIIFLTAKSQSDDVVKGFESGGDDYIKKPFSMDELIARINYQLRMAESIGVEKTFTLREIRMADFVFYPEKYELHIRSKIIKLSYKECQILSIFLSAPKTIIDRKSLLITVWGDDSYYNSRTLDVYVRKIREYFSDLDAVQIQTLKGKGYTFIVP
ncbi:MAG: response regulator transcription factor [Sphingobacteriaceae bacterium]|jgi:DNA-binding response OmpR family regulator